MAIVRRDAVQSLVGLQSCEGSRFYCCIVTKLYNDGANRSIIRAGVQISLNGIRMRFQLPEICILKLCTTPIAIASNELKCRDEYEANGIVRTAPSGALQSVGTNNSSGEERRVADRLRHHGSLNVQEHKQMLMEIQTNCPSNKRHMASSAKGSIRSGQHMLHVYAALDAEYKAFELPMPMKTSVDCSSLTKKVDSWMGSIEETHHKAQVISEESAELKQRLESLLNEIVSTRTQLVDGLDPHARPKHVDTPCGESALCLERTVVDIKDGCCKNNNFFEITSSTSEDESHRRRHCPSLTSCHAGITSSVDVHTETEEQMSNFSDADLMFEEDIEAVMQSILTDSLVEASPEFATSFPFGLKCAEEQQGDDSSDFALSEIVPDGMRSAFELNDSQHSDFLNSSHLYDAKETTVATKEALMSASNIHGLQAEKALSLNDEDSGLRACAPLFSDLCMSQGVDPSHEVEIRTPVQHMTEKRNAVNGYVLITDGSISEEAGCQSREGRHKEETVLDSSTDLWIEGTKEAANDRVPVGKNSSNCSVNDQQLEISSVVDVSARLQQRKSCDAGKRVSTQEMKYFPCLDVFEDDDSLDDASLLKMVEEHLTKTTKKRSFGFIPWRSKNRLESSLKSRRHSNGSKQSLSSIPEDTVEV